MSAYHRYDILDNRLIATTIICEFTIVVSIVTKNRLKQTVNDGIIRTLHCIHFFLCIIGVWLTFFLATMPTEFINNVAALMFMLEIIFSSVVISPVHPSNANALLRKKKVIDIISCIWLMSTIFNGILLLAEMRRPFTLSISSLVSMTIVIALLVSGFGYCHSVGKHLICAERELRNCACLEKMDDMEKKNLDTQKLDGKAKEPGNHVNQQNNEEGPKNDVAKEFSKNYVFESNYTCFMIIVISALCYPLSVRTRIVTIKRSHLPTFVNVLIYLSLFNSILDFFLSMFTKKHGSTNC